MLAAITGLAALLHTSAVAFDVVRYAGVGYLLYMAWATWREGGALTVDEETPQRSARQIIGSGILVNILNPKLTIFFFAFLPQFVPPDRPGAVAQMIQLSSVFMLVTLIVFALYGVLAAAVRRQLLQRPRVIQWMRRTFAATFVALGLRLAVADR
jgi:threonine/homoserine/homoserine lactone efflux protein